MFSVVEYENTKVPYVSAVVGREPLGGMGGVGMGGKKHFLMGFKRRVFYGKCVWFSLHSWDLCGF